MELERIRRRHLKPDQRRRIAERCESSGLSRSEFAKRNHLSLSSLQRWLRELQDTPKESPAVIFREVAVCPPVTPPALQSWAVEVVGPDGTTIRCREGWALEELAQLLRSRAC